MSHVVYYRVSTKQQGDSGLGLEAQREMVARHLNGRPALEYTEIESGKKADRPVLRKALEVAKASGATLVIAKLDRLARNVAFISSLMDSGVEFQCCDMPHANRLTLHIMAAFAEHEGQVISERTKAGLQAAKARGTKLGGYRGTYTRREQRQTLPDSVLNQIIQLRQDRLTYQEIADRLNNQGLRTVRGNKFSKVAIHRHFSRATN